ncbi:hypothetical protein RUM43_008235 [Polyplax serrata]|uniref:PEHE domain-containing protein n=1 Tax=Polyplax serrata TaxID=468196 RepID=A0AAN8Q6X3_POLSC
MSKVSPMVNGENNCGGGCGVVGGGEFGNSNVNMVAMMDSRSNKNQDFAATQDKCPKLYSCDFDHMYASVNDLSCTASQVKEAKHLKELLLLHLDLIQQQSEQIVTKDKQIAALKQDYETLKLRFERMERRVTLKRHKGSSTDKSDSIVPQPGNVDNATTQVQSETDIKSPLMGLTVVKEEVELGKESSDAGTGRRRIYKRNSQDGDVGKRRRVSTGSGVLKTMCGKKKRTTSLSSDKLKNYSGSIGDVCYGETDKRVKDRLKLRTNSAYYTIVGECDSCWSAGETPGADEFKEEAQVQVPTWREKPIAPSYVMEGTENLGDDVFSKRHQRLEIDERRRKRWDIQRIREQNHVDKLKQKLNKHQNTQSSEHPLSSFFPSIDDLEEISIEEGLPVLAFGLEIPLFENSEFSLPWSIHLQKKQKISPAS